MRDIRNEIKVVKKYGNDILKSDIFKAARNQTHHCRTTVASHSVKTAISGLKICAILRRMGIKVNTRIVVRTALLHDLGMIGRNELYRNNCECCLRHPENSAYIARQICREIDDKSIAAIESHMWPSTTRIPNTKEAFVLCMADKVASVKDWMT